MTAWGKWALAPGAHLNLKGIAVRMLGRLRHSQPTSLPAICVGSLGPGITRPLLWDVGVAVGGGEWVLALQIFISSLERDSRFTL